MTPRAAIAIERYRMPLGRRIRRTFRALVAWLCSPDFR